MRATRRFEIDAAHRLPEHEGKCRHLHGHRYAFEVTLEHELDGMGRVADFGELKATIGGWLDEQWDHATVAWKHDTKLLEWLTGEQQRCYVLSEPPTIENMVLELARVLHQELALQPVRIVGYETPSCSAEWVV